MRAGTHLQVAAAALGRELADRLGDRRDGDVGQHRSLRAGRSTAGCGASEGILAESRPPVRRHTRRERQVHDAGGHLRQRERHRSDPGHERTDGADPGHERRVDPRAQRRRAASLRLARGGHLRPRGAGGPPGAGGGGHREGRSGHGRLRDHDARPLLPRLRHAAAEQARPAHGALLRHPPAVHGLSLRPAARRRADPLRAWRGRCCWSGAEVHVGFMPWTRENFAYALGESEVAADARRVGVELALPPPCGAVRRRRSGGRAAGGGGWRARRARPRAARRRRRLRQALRAGHRLQAQALRRRGPARARATTSR